MTIKKSDTEQLLRNCAGGERWHSCNNCPYQNTGAKDCCEKMMLSIALKIQKAKEECNKALFEIATIPDVEGEPDVAMRADNAQNIVINVKRILGGK